MVYISIVIFDFSRPDFIYKAVDFLVNEISGTDSEIILIKSYKNTEIEKFLNSNNIIYIDLIAHNEQSDYINTVGRIASGEVIIFMDDDDIFYPGKIKYVSGLFQKNKNLGYYHNNFDIVDESENIIINRNYKTPRFKTLYVDNALKSEFFNQTRNLRLMLKVRPDFNSSSISIRRTILSGYKGEYNFNVRPDSFIFAFALLSPMDIMLDNKVLTHYRIYSGNVSTSYNAKIDKLRDTFISAFSAGISMFGIIKKIVKSTEYENYIELRTLNLKLAYNFWSLTRTYKIGFREKISALKVDFVNEFAYMVLSAMPKFLKLKVMKIFYHAK